MRKLILVWTYRITGRETFKKQAIEYRHGNYIMDVQTDIYIYMWKMLEVADQCSNMPSPELRCKCWMDCFFFITWFLEAKKKKKKKNALFFGTVKLIHTLILETSEHYANRHREKMQQVCVDNLDFFTVLKRIVNHASLRLFKRVPIICNSLSVGIFMHYPVW